MFKSRENILLAIELLVRHRNVFRNITIAMLMRFVLCRL